MAMAHLGMETPVTTCDDVELERRRKLIAARRRIIEREVLKYLIGEDNSGINNSNNHTYEELEDEDEYEEVVFDPTKAASEVAAALVSRSKSAERKRRSNSDSDLYTMDENREVELCSAAKTVLKITVEDADDDDLADVTMPEQGFYRVYDDLEKIREFDLIPYVLERKKREQELREVLEKQGAEKATTETEKTSPDSGRASVVSSDLSEAASSANDHDKRKTSKSDAGSSCSADSGTYNLFPEASGVAPSEVASFSPRERSKSNDFLKRLSAQLSSVALRRPFPPPMPPKGKATPPPLPPRTFGRRQRSPRRKDLSSHLGLVTEASAPSDRAVAHEVAMRNLPSQLTGDSGASPPGRKDLKRHLGVHEITDVMPPAQNNFFKRLSPPKPSQLLVQLHLHQQLTAGSPAKAKNLVKMSSPASPSPTELYSVKKSCRRELDFGAATSSLTDTSRSKSRALGAPTPPPTPGSALKALASASGRSGGRSVASKIFFKRHNQTPRRHSSRSPSPYKLKSGGLTPVSVRKFKAKESRRSFMSSLLSSAKTRQVSASADPIVAPTEFEGVAERKTRDYSRTVKEALRDGLPVIPFGSSSMDELSGRASNVYLPMGTTYRPAARRGAPGTWSPGSTTGLAAALATPARGARQHCQSCTCNGGGGGGGGGRGAMPGNTMAMLDLDYVRMETPRLRQRRRKSLSEIVTDPFLA